MDVGCLLVGLNCLLFSVVRSRETLVFLYAVVVPLGGYKGEECVAKEFPKITTGEMVVIYWGGRAILEKMRQNRDFNPTLGFPGQDIIHLVQ